MSSLYDDTEDFETESLLKEISDSLGEQVAEELSKGEEGASGSGPAPAPAEPKKRKAGKGRKVRRALLIGGGALAALALAVFLAGNYFLNRLNFESEKDVVMDTNEKGDEVKADELEDIVPSDKSIINILLIGEEAMSDQDRGRSDVMMVLTINQKYKRLVLTSFLRDSYVTPQGYSPCKLNEVYKKGGGPLLVSTIEQYFQVQIDGYARVNFDSFEEIIDLLGGVEIELTAEEAAYLNRTNYISDKSNRNVVEGKQTLNGNQVLGYTRVRYVKGINGERDDFARTNRQRLVIHAIFDKYKSKSLIDLVSITNKILPHITTNMKKMEILQYLASAAGLLGTADLETFRVPMDDAYSGEKINGKSVLVVDFAKANAALQDEMYGEGYLTDEEREALEEQGQEQEGQSTDGTQEGT